MSRARSKIPEGTYIELVQSLFRTLLPTTLIALSFISVASVIVAQTSDLVLTVISVAGSALVVVRLGILLIFRHKAADPQLSMAAARRLERLFAASYLGFAAAFGLFGARSFYVASPDSHVLVAVILVGYGAGVAAGIALRPWIGLTAIVLGVAPTIVVALASGNLIYWAVGGLLAVFLGGGMQSMLANYKLASEGITMKRVYADMAASDGLTGLSNRLGLERRFNDVTVIGRRPGDLAVHCLDLDLFKPVNDQYGHPVGDLLLQAVADRLNRTLRSSDFAARIGGDEFVLVQHGITDETEADLLARRIVRVISEPYAIGDLTISISTSVGFALLSQHGHALETLIAAADRALLRAKAAGGGCATQDGGLRRAG